MKKKTKKAPRKAKAPDPGINDVFEPGVVKVTCGCSKERAERCLQRGFYHEHTLAGTPIKRDNEHCHIFVDELDLIRLKNDVIQARFAKTRQLEAEDE